MSTRTGLRGTFRRPVRCAGLPVPVAKCRRLCAEWVHVHFMGPHFGYVDVPHVQITRPRKEAYSGTCLAHVAKSAGSRGPTHTFTKHPWMAGQVSTKGKAR